MATYFWIAIGSAFGGVARFWLSGVVARLMGETFPWGTLIVNVTGSLAIGTDRLHYSSDLLLNGSVIVALVLDQFTNLKGADAVFGLLICVRNPQEKERSNVPRACIAVSEATCSGVVASRQIT